MIEELAREKNINIQLYNIIYDLINNIKAEMEKIIEPKIKQTEIGKLKVLALFKTDKGEQIIGGKVLTGIIEPNTIAKVTRNNELITKGNILKLQSGKQDVNSVAKDEECGLQFSGQPIIKEGDIIQIFKEEKIAKKL
jgi:translation initiation factor IF-2